MANVEFASPGIEPQTSRSDKHIFHHNTKLPLQTKLRNVVYYTFSVNNRTRIWYQQNGTTLAVANPSGRVRFAVGTGRILHMLTANGKSARSFRILPFTLLNFQFYHLKIASVVCCCYSQILSFISEEDNSLSSSTAISRAASSTR